MGQGGKKLSATFVTPWYGSNLPGGAEAEARRTAQNLAEAGVDVHVLTTCLAGLGTDWDHDTLPPGETTEDGVKVRRFPTAQRDGEAFNKLNARVCGNERISQNSEEQFYANMVHSPELLDHIAAHPEEGPFFFIPYLFTTSAWGPLIHPEKSVIIPCLHDEGYARMASIKRAFEASRAVVFHVPAEKELADHLYDLDKTEALVLGEGVDTRWTGDAERFRKNFGITAPFVLYAGRKDPGKNTPLLIQYFLRFIKDHPDRRDLKLVLIGNLPAPIPPGAEDSIIDLGFVDVKDKYDAYHAAEVFVQPSLLESFSIVIMEAWLAETPVMVHSGCAVTKEHAEASRGGLHFADYPTFAESLDLLLSRPELNRALGQAGRRYVLDSFSWPRITERYHDLIEKISTEPIPEAKYKGAWQKAVSPPEPPAAKVNLIRPAVHQMLPDFAYGDAIGNDVLAIRKCLKSWGLNSEIFAKHVHPKLSGKALDLADYPGMVRDGDILMFHFSIGHPVAEELPGLPGRKILRYHNITPAKYLEQAFPESAERARLGRRQLGRLASCVELGIGVSDYNCRELVEAGCAHTAEVPILLDLGQLSTAPDPLVLNRFTGKRFNILHVGRIAPNKCIEDLLKTQYWLSRLLPGVRLHLVGGGSWRTAYGSGLRKMVEDYRIPDVNFAGHVNDAELMAYYRAADLYLCLSAHEGFCVPLVESMHFSMPIVAQAEAGVPGTLGPGGVLLKKRDPLFTAEVIAHILTNKPWRSALSQAAKERLDAFRPTHVAGMLKKTLKVHMGLELT